MGPSPSFMALVYFVYICYLCSNASALVDTKCIYRVLFTLLILHFRLVDVVDLGEAESFLGPSPSFAPISGSLCMNICSHLIDASLLVDNLHTQLYTLLLYFEEKHWSSALDVGSFGSFSLCGECFGDMEV